MKAALGEEWIGQSKERLQLFIAHASKSDPTLLIPSKWFLAFVKAFAIYFLRGLNATYLLAHLFYVIAEN